jgi:gamma-glutamyl-gamma-aminobutyrate hydrolase PuuD
VKRKTVHQEQTFTRNCTGRVHAFRLSDSTRGSASEAVMPVIGITTSLSTPEGGAAPSQSVPIAYACAVADAGGTPLLLPMLQTEHHREECERIVGACDAFVIVGGGVISKGMVGAQPDDLSDTPTLRDESDTAYLSLAMKAKKPVLGICYGMQFINAHLGGGITADWQAHMGGGAEHAHSPSRECNEHALGMLVEGSKIERILHAMAPGSAANDLLVNSYHLQGVGPEMLADGLVVTATAAGAPNPGATLANWNHALTVDVLVQMAAWKRSRAQTACSTEFNGILRKCTQNHQNWRC